MDDTASTCVATCANEKSETVAATHTTGENGSNAKGNTQSQYQGFTAGDSSSSATKTPANGGEGGENGITKPPASLASVPVGTTKASARSLTVQRAAMAS